MEVYIDFISAISTCFVFQSLCNFPADAGHTKTEEQQGPTDDLNAETGASSGLSKVISEDDSKTQYAVYIK